jgi:stress response protein SCP2
MHILTKADGNNPLYGTDEQGRPTGTDTVEELHLGLSWEAVGETNADNTIGKLKGWAKRKQREAEGKTDPSDLDAGALFFVGDKPTKYLGFDNFDPFKDEPTPREQRSASHTGDNRTGAGDGDDELIKLTLRDIPQRFTRILLVVGAYKPGADIRAARDVKATVYDATGGSATAVAQIEPSLMEDKDILAIAALDRVPNDTLWTLAVADTSFNITKGDIRSLLRQSVNAF